MSLALWLVVAAAWQGGDTLSIGRGAAAAVLDGRAGSAEYGAPDLRLPTGRGTALVWLRQRGSSVVIAARIADTTRGWRDGLTVSLDPRGARDPGPDHGAIEWDLRRAADSSVVYRGRGGRWMPPGDDPDWRLGATRRGEGWALWTADDATGWSLELELDADWLAGDAGRLPTLAITVFDDSPMRWVSWPAPAGVRPQSVERLPRLWGIVRLLP